MQSSDDLSLGASGSACPPLGPSGSEKVDVSCQPLPKEFLAKIMAVSKPVMGTRHRYGGTGPGGFDCSGFTAYVYKQFGIKLPRGSYNQLPLGRPVARQDLRPGDLVFFKISRRAVVTHVGIYIGNDQMVHASIQKGVTIDRVFGDDYYNTHYYGACRLPQVEAQAVTASK
ncbi:C40 family peptidase [Megalodesulfovibrio paquesii]